ncbi:MAG: hypothetical protein Q4G08_07045, partial [Capnocytophaga sp.]|nr:hypothetical protein [Capnocytophaga sp.]
KGIYKVAKGSLKAVKKSETAIEVVGKVGDVLKIASKSAKIGIINNNIINFISGDVRKFSEYALTNLSKKGLFVDSWGYKLEDAESLLKIYKEQAVEAIKNGETLFPCLNRKNLLKSLDWTRSIVLCKIKKLPLALAGC